ncbi:putative mannose 6-phosphate receptor-like protein [Erysiphe neolycopersici]|uniref:Putative mannose 6-phosphate receptor-like protein n=1 Tax=Erysiphe neolycopersici TaxID=212602 RepID=A0A420I7K5_9PEZI|nr:putative mannose 6-phosphate receptor-like protein [Erysiphe neolycopersici]
MFFLYFNILFYTILIHGRVSAGASDKESTSPAKTVKPCTISSPTGIFYDLNELRVTLPKDPKKPPKGARLEDWKARGYDYHNNQANFTLNVCGSLAEKQTDFVGVDRSLWQNVSAYYQLGAERFSIGQENSTLKLRGRRLILEYRYGSPCGDRGTGRKEDNNLIRRKSSIISFHCDKDPLAAPSSGIVTYVGNSDDECSYYFEVLSKVACMTAEPTKQSIGPGAVFALICIIAILVYFLGGVFYQRNVAHARGWRQLPNYVIWAGIGNFIKVSWYFFSNRLSLEKPSRDIFTAVTSSCSGFVPNSRGYTLLYTGRGLHSRAEDENRLIDQLDEEWDD